MARRDSAGPTFEHERLLSALHEGPVCGVDEAGRGPLAGPVVAAAVILDGKNVPAGLNDSKKLGESTRERLYDEIIQTARVGIAVGDVERIDRDNILRATLWAMCEAVCCLDARPAVALIDGNRAPDLPCPAVTLVAGDALSLSIAAASIVAKVTRDRLMYALSRDWPHYGFERHKGYGTAAHLAALNLHGPSPHHRRSFAPVRNLIARAVDIPGKSAR